MQHIDATQDGGDFYYWTLTGEHVWSAPAGTVKNDNDMEGARTARTLFIEAMNTRDIEVSF